MGYERLGRDLRYIKLAKHTQTFDQRDFDLTHACKVKFGFRSCTGELEEDDVRGIAGDLACQSFNAFGAFGA